MILKAGTYRFNDVLIINPDSVLQQEFAFTFNWSIYVNEEMAQYYKEQTGLDIEVGYHITKGYCSKMRVENETGSDILAYTIVRGEGGIMEGAIDNLETNDYLHKWKTDYNAQTITLDTDQTVTEEFGTWFMANIEIPLATITYNGETIAQLNAGETCTLKCGSTDEVEYKMATDVVVKIESGYVKPSGSITVTENSTVNVAGKAEVIVNVPTYLTVSTEDEALDETTIPIVEGQIIIVEG
jgi:hypothetical protein